MMAWWSLHEKEDENIKEEGKKEGELNLIDADWKDKEIQGEKPIMDQKSESPFPLLMLECFEESPP